MSDAQARAVMTGAVSAAAYVGLWHFGGWPAVMLAMGWRLLVNVALKVS